MEGLEAPEHLAQVLAAAVKALSGARPEQVRGLILCAGIYDMEAFLERGDMIRGGLLGWGVGTTIWAYTGKGNKKFQPQFDVFLHGCLDQADGLLDQRGDVHRPDNEAAPAGVRQELAHQVQQVGGILAVVDGESRIQADLMGMFAQEASADPVECTGPGQGLGRGLDGVRRGVYLDFAEAIERLEPSCARCIDQVGVTIGEIDNERGCRQEIEQGRWQKSEQFCLFTHDISELFGATIGIVGEGAIGRGRKSAKRAL